MKILCPNNWIREEDFIVRGVKLKKEDMLRSNNK